MSYALVPIVKFRSKKMWKELDITVGKEYPVWVHRGHGLFFTDAYVPMTVTSSHLKRAKRNRDSLYKLVKRSR
jgi:hypothetical protein